MQASDILKLGDRRTKTIFVEEWDREVVIQELGLESGLRVFAKVRGDEIESQALEVAQVVAWSVIDPDTGRRVFDDDDVPALMEKNLHALMAIYRAVVSLSSQSVEGAKKN